MTTFKPKPRDIVPNQVRREREDKSVPLVNWTIFWIEFINLAIIATFAGYSIRHQIISNSIITSRMAMTPTQTMLSFPSLLLRVYTIIADPCTFTTPLQLTPACADWVELRRPNKTYGKGPRSQRRGSIP